MRLKVVQGWRDLPVQARGAAVAFGNFDGVHRGHQQVIANAARAARELGCPLAAVTFEPHPARMLTPGMPPFRLMTPGQQARALDDLGVELLYELPFDAEMHAMSDETFARDVLAEGLGARHIAVGFDVTFGYNRSGDGPTMRAYGERFGFGVSIAEAVTDAKIGKISSSAIREALKAGLPGLAAEMLGRPFAIEAEIITGKKLGRELGFPTANAALGDYIRPRFGVYATRSRLPDGRCIPGVASLGINPTHEIPEPRLETWLFDFDEDIYGQVLETQLIAFLRDEAKFESLDILAEQVLADAAEARALLMPDLG